MTITLKRATDKTDTVVEQRTDRFFKKYDHWYFKTREGAHMGPYKSRKEASIALNDFIEFLMLAKPETRSQLSRSLS